MKNFWFSIAFVLSVIAVNSQTQILTRHLKWIEPQSSHLKAQFENCSYDNKGVPLYYEVFEVDKLGFNINANIEVEILDIETESFRNDFVSKIVSNSDVELKSKLYYGGQMRLLELSFYPFVSKSGDLHRIISFKLKFRETKTIVQRSFPNYKENSVLQSGKWIKIPIIKAGAYKLSYTQIQSLGFSNPQNVRVFGNNKGMLSFMNNNTDPDDLLELPIFKTNDYIVFYAEGASLWEYNSSLQYFYQTPNHCTDTAFVFLTDYNSYHNNSISLYEENNISDITIKTGIVTLKHENDLINLVYSGRMWLGEDFMFETKRNVTFNISNIKTNQPSKLIYAVACRSPLASTMKVSYPSGSETLSFLAYQGYDYYQYVDYKLSIKNITPTSNNIIVNFDFNKPTSSANAWIDYVLINANVDLVYTDQLIFYNTQNLGQSNYSKFEISNCNSNLQVWDISDPTNPLQIKYNLSNGVISFVCRTHRIQKFIIFDPSKAPSPDITKSKSIANQNLHNIDANIEMLILTHPNFLTQAQQIANIHQNHDSIKCMVVDIEKIYNEFSSGMKDVAAIRNFIRMVYFKTNLKLKYVLLFGDGTFNNKGATTATNPNYFPTFQSLESFNINDISFTTDDFFGHLDENEGEGQGKLDVAIGRYTIKTTKEADLMVEKLNSYYNTTNFGDWQNVVTLLSDDRDQNADDFVSDNEDLANTIENNYKFINFKKIYLDAYQQVTMSNGQQYPEANADLNNRINMGALIVNYFGHGSEERLSSESLITKNSVNKWSNFDRLALFVTGTCKFSRFDYADPTAGATSAGEKLLLDNNGSAIAMISTSRVTYAGNNLFLIKRISNYIFNNTHTIGSAYQLAKNLTNDNNKRIFVLLGNPAVKLNVPQNRIVLTKINDKPIGLLTDTIKALSRVKIEGIVTDLNYYQLTNFNGKISITLFDKKIQTKTLNNDGNGAMNYWNQFTILFKGITTVKNGTFKAEFQIPKDINYSYDKAKFSFFASNNTTSATGFYNNFILGGIEQNVAIDTTPPIIKLYMNDTLFVNGGTTNTSPTIIAILEDNSGINLSSASVGHDIVATIDNNTNTKIILNEYFETYPDNFNKGVVKYQLFNLTPGNHTLTLKAFDIYNNSSQKTINFTVVDNQDLSITRLYNYPNPFTTNTSFYFEHNKPNTFFEILIQIYSPSGKIIKTIQKQMQSNGYRSEAIQWDGRDDYGARIAPGTYIYSLKIRTNDGKVYQKLEKLVKLK